jgi:cell division protein FtsI (penicillin-binding protein 3)
MILAFASCNDTEINIPNKVECDLVKQAYHKLPTNNIYDGYKVATSIDTAIQAISEKCLMQNLKNLNAEYGCVIVMGTSTGKIKAFVNLSKTDSSIYENKLNNAVCNTIEPGSLFHIYDVMQLLEDKLVDTNAVLKYDGKYVFNGNTITDNHILDLDSISLSNAFVYSSKTVFAKEINTYYSEKPAFFQKDFKKLGFHKKLDIPFESQGISKILTPFDKNWNQNSLIYQSIGYGISLTPIQILTFYNAIANHGEMVKPLFLSQITNEKGQKKVYKKEVLQPKICSDKTLNKLQALLEKTVSEGSSHCAYSSKIKIAGKQATIDLNVASQNTNNYYSTFVGYFPSNKPQYTAMVVVYKPSDFYYGISGRIFTDIANRLNIN